MTRVTTTILVLMVLMNGTVGIMEASGLSEDLDVNLAPGVSEQLDESVEAAKNGFSPGSGPLESLTGILLAAKNVVEAIIAGVFAAPSMFMNLGFPSWFVMPLFVPMYIIAVLEIVYVASGREMV